MFPDQIEIEAGMRSPLHIPAPTHGHLAATEPEKSFVSGIGDYESRSSAATNGNDRAKSLDASENYSIQFFAQD
jgi:hypothetical protein